MAKTIQDRHIWVQVARGQVKLDNYLLQAGDGAAISQAESVMLVGQEQAEVLLFDLALSICKSEVTRFPVPVYCKHSVINSSIKYS
ncbi:MULTISPECIES: hypothetical protein [unclassified Moorena]|nr:MULTISPECIES: hypothetical protein [unclassified Moorena]NEO23137.1 hypothetical protein [Moorena sp. SIO4A5]NEQ57664.1 hypothetical protein [Moorena sp. SIO4A1]